MGFTVLLYFLASALTPCCSTRISREVSYECGPHGKFEYCIDEIPGCITGCHCHPGYYFDTDTKICEPNVKLTQHFRQHYLAEPTPTATVFPTPTSSATVTAHYDDQRHETIQDTDELGDWLYNQFFKTIESQVINNSNNTKPSNEKPPTRRSGGGRDIKKPKRKMRKPSRRRKKKKHTNDHGLSRKLLRITEDDSLFDSNSDSDESVSSSSDSDSSSDSSADIDTSDRKKSSETDTDCTDDNDHGHKKVIIFNRRPKPPLPSFIFLPNMDTPYYPPIGLPPPPLVPMYPMVPVPPMPPPMFLPFPGTPKCDGENKTAAIESTTTTTTSTTTTTETPNSQQSQTNPPVAPSQNQSNPSNRRTRPEKHHKRLNPGNNVFLASEPGQQKKLKQKNKLMQKLRDKLEGKRRNNIKPAQPLENIQDDDLQNIDDLSNISADNTPQKQLHKQDQKEDHIPKLEDVDFKYLSELIHRVNQTRSRNKPPLPFDLNEDLKELRKLQLSHPSRRNFDSYKSMPQVYEQGTDEIYYSNLGRQIATMVRNAGSNGDHQFMKESHPDRQLPIHFFLNANSPRSFWERSVRSPVPQKVLEYLDASRTLRHSTDEKSLINLENEVKVFASTPPPMRLQDLENILSTIQKAHAQIQFRQPMTNTKQSNESLNVNLLPNHVRRTYSRLFDTPKKVEYITERYQNPSAPITPLYPYQEIHPAVEANMSVFHEPEKKFNLPYSDYWMFNPVPIQSKTSKPSQQKTGPKPVFDQTSKPIQPKTKPKPVFDQTSNPIMPVNHIYYTNTGGLPYVIVLQPKYNDTKKSRGDRPKPVFGQTSKPIIYDNQVYYTNPVRQPYVSVVQPKYNDTKKSHADRLQFLKSRSLKKQNTPKTPKPKLVKYKSLNYFSGNKHFMFEAASYPLLPAFKMQFSKRISSKPSYLHQQSHRFKFFD